MVVLSCLPEGIQHSASVNAGTPAPQPLKLGMEAALQRTANPTAVTHGTTDEWEEVRADGIYSLNLEKAKEGLSVGGWNAPSPRLHTWRPISWAVGVATVVGQSIVECSSQSQSRRQQRSFSEDSTLRVVVGDQLAGSAKQNPAGHTRLKNLSSGMSCATGCPRDETDKLLSSVHPGRLSSSPCLQISTAEEEGELKGGKQEDEQEQVEGEEGQEERDMRGGEEEIDLRSGSNEAEKERKVSAKMGCVSAREQAVPCDEVLLSPAAAGLLSKLRGSIYRRISNIPYFNAPRGLGVERGGRHLLATSDSNVKRTAEESQHTGEAAPETEPGDSPTQTTMRGAPGLDGGTENDTSSLQFSHGDTGVTVEVVPIPARVGVLFSGGLDSVVLAAMLAEGGNEGGKGSAVPEGEAIDLVNVCFDRCDQGTTKCSMEMRCLKTPTQFSFHGVQQFHCRDTL